MSGDRLSRRALAAALLAVGLLVGSCSDGGQYLDPKPTGNPMTQQQQFSELMNRPNLDETIARYEEMRGKLRDRLTTEFGLPAWQEQTESARFSGCAPQFAAVNEQDASRKFLSRWFVAAPLLTNWQKAKKAVSEVAGIYGFDRVSLDTMKPDDAEFNLNDQYGAELSFGSATNTVITLTTGCHLSAEAKKRGTPRQS